MGTSFIFDLIIPYKFNFRQESIDEHLHRSNNGKKSVIVFFNESTFDANVKTKFEFYGGNFKQNEEWNSLFNNFSGFAGVIPIENISIYKQEFPEINIETDEIIEVQMNYASIQTQSVNSTWYINGYKGNTDSSIAVLDSGVNLNHDFLQGRIIGSQNFISQDPMTDDNGHGTFISSVIAGTGTSTYNSISPSTVNLYGNYYHLDLFDEIWFSKNYSVKIFSTNISKSDSII
jgi:subtilisin family serine protease